MNATVTRGLVSVATVAWMLAGTGPAQASCAVAPPLHKAVADAKILFVGTVTETTNYARWAVVSVEEVWKGKRIPNVVQVRGGTADAPGPMRSASSVDRTYKSDRRYLFFPYGRKGAVLQDSICSSTRVFTERLSRFRPETTGEPEAGPHGPDAFDPGTGPGPVAIVGAVVSGLVAAFGARKLTTAK